MQKTLSVVNLSAIRSNARYVRSLIGNRVFYAVVKAEAYGHGGVEVALALQDIVDGFCVAVVEEGAQLRVGGVTKPVLVLAPPLSESDAAAMAYYGLSATVTDERSAELCTGCSKHIAINTGMNRYGCFGKELERALNRLPSGSVEGVYSHLYAADNDRECLAQLKLFEDALKLVKVHSPRAVAHLAASGGILRGGEYLFEGVRCGLLLYGYCPKGFDCDGVRPALEVYARLAQRTRVVGGGVGYNLADKAYEKLFTYRLGYADGFARSVPLGEKTLCMDAFVSEREEELLPVMTDADAYAERCGTISYEVLCSVTKRSERIYVYDNGQK